MITVTKPSSPGRWVWDQRCSSTPMTRTPSRRVASAATIVWVASMAMVFTVSQDKPKLPGHRRHRGTVDHQPAQDVAGAPPGGRPASAGQPIGVVGEHFPIAGGVDTPVARHPNPQP